MSKNQVKGRTEEVKGKVKEVAGKVVGDEALELKGNIQKVGGKIRANTGDLKKDTKNTR